MSMAASESPLPFASLVARGLRDRGLTLRAFCRSAGLDPSFFSKVLSGKRSPPSEESVLRRIAELLDLGPAELIVSAGRIPSEWRALWEDPELLRDVHARMLEAGRSWSRRAPQNPPKSRHPAKTSYADTGPRFIAPRKDLAEELL